jgi:TRAP-type C4-dicarboxylate transport system substrate-binding protein
MAEFQRAVVLLAGLVLALVTGCTGPGWDKAGGTQAPEPVVLTLANFMGDSGELTGFANEVQRLSDGAMRIDIKGRWRLGQAGFETGLIGDVRAGKADLGVTGSEAWDSVGVTAFRALDAPLLIDSYAVQERVVRSPMIGQMLAGLRPLGLDGIGVLPGPLRQPLGIARPLLGPSDYAGLTIGIQESLVADATMRALGARPAWFTSDGPIAGLGGIEQQISQIQWDNYDKAGKYLTANVSLWPQPLALFANAKTWATLTPVQQRVLSQAVTDDQVAETQFVSDNERSDTAILCRRGLRFLTASPADLAALRQAVQSVYGQLERDPQTLRYIRQIEAMSEGVPAEPVPRCGQTAPLAENAGPLDGVWRFTTTATDLRAAGAPQSDIVPENYGTYTFVFDRGRFAFTQEDRQACTWGYGTFMLNATRMEWLFTDGGGIAPDNAANEPGEFFTFGWSLYRGVLMLSPVKGAVSPNPSLGKSWVRISTTPSARFLSRRCLPPAGVLQA